MKPGTREYGEAGKQPHSTEARLGNARDRSHSKLAYRFTRVPAYPLIF